MSGHQLELFNDPATDGNGPPLHPGHYIAEELKERDWTQADLSRIIQRPIPTINEIINGKKALMPEMAIALARAFGTSPQLWAHREAAYRIYLATSSADDSNAEDLAELYSSAPVKDIEKRGWIAKTTSAEDLRRELVRFFGNDDLSLNFVATARKSGEEANYSPSQKAWLRRAEQLARVVPVSKFSDFNLTYDLDLRSLAKKSDSIVMVPQALARMGIRFVVVEPLPKSRIDGAAFWLDSNSPVVALSARFDRIDSFWHTLAHELSHISHRDAFSLDIDIVGTERSQHALISDFEKRADDEGANWLVPQDKIRSFINRHNPFFSADDIEMFGRRIGVHAGIVVGQLHHLGAIEFKHHRAMLTKVKSLLTAVATTDGFGAPLIQMKSV